MLLFVVILLIPFSNCLQTKLVKTKTIRSVFGKYLQNHVFKSTYHSQDIQHCISDCWVENERCQSFNYLPDLNICELNDRSKDNAPDDYIDKDRSVYLTNPRFGKRKLQMPRYASQYSQVVADACQSNPCQNQGECSPDDKTGFRCTNCAVGYYGLMCELEVDPCLSNPCKNSGKCIKLQKQPMRCECAFPFEGDFCQNMNVYYHFVLTKTSENPIIQIYRASSHGTIGIWFWFKTSQAFAPFFSIVPDDYTKESLKMWKVNSTIYVKFWEGVGPANFTFPYSYNTSDNTWHSVMLKFIKPDLTIYLDGVQRETRKYTVNKKITIPKGIVKLGYCIDDEDMEHHFEGMISPVRQTDRISSSFNIQNEISHKCPGDTGKWKASIWEGFHLAEKSIPSCGVRLPPNKVYNWVLKEFDRNRWLVYSVAPPRNLNAFTLSFWLSTWKYPVNNEFDIACYASESQCGIHVSLLTDQRLLIKVNQASAVAAILPIFDNLLHHVAITWTNVDGILELLIDGMFMGSWKGVAKEGIVQGSTDFIAGGSKNKMANFLGTLFEVNLWDHVLPVDLLYFMARYKGNDRGNVVNWKGFRPSEVKYLEKSSQNLAHQVGDKQVEMIFNSTDPGNYAIREGRVLDKIDELTIIMWFQIESFPAVLMSHGPKDHANVILVRVTSSGLLGFSFPEDYKTVATLDSRHFGTWHFLGISWKKDGGEIYINFDFNEIIKQNFHGGKPITSMYPYWFMSSPTTGLNGKIARLHVWDKAVDDRVIKQMARTGGTNFFQSFAHFPKASDYTPVGNVVEQEGSLISAVTYPVQMKRDEYCRTVITNAGCILYARLGPGSIYSAWNIIAKQGIMMGCYCEEDLSTGKTIRMISGNANFDFSDELFNIK